MESNERLKRVKIQKTHEERGGYKKTKWPKETECTDRDAMTATIGPQRKYNGLWKFAIGAQYYSKVAFAGLSFGVTLKEMLACPSSVLWYRARLLYDNRCVAELCNRTNDFMLRQRKDSPQQWAFVVFRLLRSLLPKLVCDFVLSFSLLSFEFLDYSVFLAYKANRPFVLRELIDGGLEDNDETRVDIPLCFGGTDDPYAWIRGPDETVVVEIQERETSTVFCRSMALQFRVGCLELMAEEEEGNEKENEMRPVDQIEFCVAGTLWGNCSRVFCRPPKIPGNAFVLFVDLPPPATKLENIMLRTEDCSTPIVYSADSCHVQKGWYVLPLQDYYCRQDSERFEFEFMVKGFGHGRSKSFNVRVYWSCRRLLHIIRGESRMVF